MKKQIRHQTHTTESESIAPSPSKGNGSISTMGNSERALQILRIAAQEEGVSTENLLFGTHPDQFLFAEDGDEQSTIKQERRQQQDRLPDLRPKHEGSKYEDFSDGVAFVKGANDTHAIDPNDVKQGALGDCYLIAGMAAVARADPKLIQDLIKDNGDGTFEVSLYIRPSNTGYPRKVTKTVDARLAVNSSGSPLYAGTGDQESGKIEMWTALIEKALAQHKNSYDLISGSNIRKGNFNYAGTSELLTGKVENYLSTDELTPEEALTWIQIALESKKPVTTASRNLEDEAITAEAKSHNIYWNHAYAPVSVDMKAQTVDLQNPWGRSHVKSLSAKDFIRFYRNIRIGG